MNKYSKNAKLNKLCCEIEDYIVSNYDNMDKCIQELKKFKNEFPSEPDYNYAQYGGALVYYEDIKELYLSVGYQSVKKWSYDILWEDYKARVGYVIRRMIK